MHDSVHDSLHPAANIQNNPMAKHCWVQIVKHSHFIKSEDNLTFCAATCSDGGDAGVYDMPVEEVL